MLTPVALPPGRFVLATSASRTGSPPTMNTIGIVAVAALAASAAYLGWRRDHGYLPANQIVRKRGQAIVVTLGPSVFDRDVLVRDVVQFGQALKKSGNAVCRDRPR